MFGNKFLFNAALFVQVALLAACSTEEAAKTASSSSVSSAGVSASRSSSTSSASSSTSSSSSANSSASSSSSSSSVSSSPSSGSALSIHVDGKLLKDGAGNVIQLRGVNLMGFEYTAISGWSPANPYPQLPETSWGAMHTWKVNAIRIPINSASWFNISCVDGTGAIRDADPGNNYQSTLRAVVDRATQEGLYVILDLHWSAPNDAARAVNGVSAMCAIDQNPVADADYALPFWTELATAYKNYPNVLFELFNEPYLNSWGNAPASPGPWPELLLGTTMGSYQTGYGGNYEIAHPWRSAGMQEMLTAVRNTGATNVVLASGLQWTQQLDQWLTYKPADPLNQLAAAWHAYPTFGTTWGSDAYKLPNFGEGAYTAAQNILNSGIPVIVTEFGDRNTDGTVGSPFASSLLPRLDIMGGSYFGWTFTPSGESDNILLKDYNGTPTDGFGVYVKQHYICRSTTATCQ